MPCRRPRSRARLRTWDTSASEAIWSRNPALAHRSGAADDHVARGCVLGELPLPLVGHRRAPDGADESQGSELVRRTVDQKFERLPRWVHPLAWRRCPGESRDQLKGEGQSGAAAVRDDPRHGPLPPLSCPRPAARRCARRVSPPGHTVARNHPLRSLAGAVLATVAVI